MCAGKKYARPIVRRVRRGGRARPGTVEQGRPGLDHRGTETADAHGHRGITGKELADDLLQGVSSEQMRAATRLLGAHHDGYWLRRFFEDQELADAAGQPLLEHAGPRPSIDWNAVGLLLLADRPPAHKASSSEVAVLEFAASLVGRAPIQLQRVIHAVDDTEFRLLLRALMAAAYGETH